MKNPPSLALLACALMASGSMATAESTDPVGFSTVVLRGSSDTAVTLPLHRPSSFEGIVDSVEAESTIPSGSGDITVNNVIFPNTPFVSSQFDPGNAAQITPVDESEDASYKGNSYYLLIKSGALEGKWFQILENTDSSAMVVNGGIDLADALNSITGESVAIIPFWRLPRIFPRTSFGTDESDDEIVATSTPSPSNASIVYYRDPADENINHPVALGFFYYTGSALGGNGWRRQGSSFAIKQDDFPFPPDAALVVRHNSSGDTTLTVTGSVPMVSGNIEVGTLLADTPQDNHVPVPSIGTVPDGEPYAGFLDVTLSESQLVQSGAVEGNAFPTPKDLVFVVDNDSADFNKPPALGYFYYSGPALGGEGWRRQGSPFTTIFDDHKVFRPGQTIIIRKAGSPSPTVTDWVFTPSYLSEL